MYETPKGAFGYLSLLSLVTSLAIGKLLKTSINVPNTNSHRQVFVNKCVHYC